MTFGAWFREMFFPQREAGDTYRRRVVMLTVRAAEIWPRSYVLVETEPPPGMVRVLERREVEDIGQAPFMLMKIRGPHALEGAEAAIAAMLKAEANAKDAKKRPA